MHGRMRTGNVPKTSRWTGAPVDFRTFFGQHVRRLRLGAGETQEQIGCAVRYSGDAIRKMESGDRPPPEGVEDYLDDHYDAKGLLAALGREARTDSRAFPDWVEQEQRATDIRTYDMRVIPGLLQTEDYARTMIKTVSPWLDIEAQVEMRLARQAVLGRATVRAVIEQAALERVVGGPAMQREQLKHLRALPENVAIQIVPTSALQHPGLSGPLTILRFAKDSPLVRGDSRGKGEIVDDPVGVSRAERVFDGIIAAALPEHLSAEMIDAMIEELSRDDL